MLKTAFILHTRYYRDTSLLIDFFTAQEGRVTAIARGAKRPKSHWRGILQPFTPLLINYIGRHDLQTLITAEANDKAITLVGDKLFSAFYMNELLMRTLQPYEPYSNLFAYYERLLQQLAVANAIEPLLRCFEMTLLQELGYALQLDYLQDNTPVEAHNYYQYNIEEGIIIPIAKKQANTAVIFLGKSLLALAQQDFSDIQTRRDAKRLLRLSLSPLLGNKPLYSRQLFLRKPYEPNLPKQ